MHIFVQIIREENISVVIVVAVLSFQCAFRFLDDDRDINTFDVHKKLQKIDF